LAESGWNRYDWLQDLFMMKTKTALFILAISTTVGLAAQTDSATQYKRMCTLCHGTDGKSDTSMGKSLKSADLTSPMVQLQSDAQIYDVIAHGKGKMAAYETILGKQGVQDMVKYVRTLAPPKKK
jgi:mono/diheme cytochrome c family protein